MSHTNIYLPQPVKTFTTLNECHEYFARYPELLLPGASVSTLTSWDQLNQHLLGPLVQGEQKESLLAAINGGRKTTGVTNYSGSPEEDNYFVKTIQAKKSSTPTSSSTATSTPTATPTTSTSTSIGISGGDKKLNSPLSRQQQWLTERTVQLAKQVGKSMASYHYNDNHTNSSLKPSSSMTMVKSAVYNTLRHLFVRQGSGIFVKIYQNRLAMFVPFDNDNYKNTWSELLEKPELQKYYQHHRRAGSTLLPPPSSTTTTTSTLVAMLSEFEKYLFPMLDLLTELCQTRRVRDVDFFLSGGGFNGFPQLTTDSNSNSNSNSSSNSSNNTGSDDEEYVPICSSYSNDKFADVIIPTPSDWAAATKNYWTPISTTSSSSSSSNSNSSNNNSSNNDVDVVRCQKSTIKWKSKKEVCFFRGCSQTPVLISQNFQHLPNFHLQRKEKTEIATTTTANNSSIGSSNSNSNICSGSDEDDDDEKAVKKTKTKLKLSSPPPLVPLDVQIANFGTFDRISESGEKLAIDFVTTKKFDSGVSVSVPVPVPAIAEWEEFKYLLHFPEDSTCPRLSQHYGRLLASRSVIFLVSPNLADKSYASILLKPMIDHIPVKADLSDLEEKLVWAKTHDTECMQIAANALKLHQTFFSKSAILDYWQLLLMQFSRLSQKSANSNGASSTSLSSNEMIRLLPETLGAPTLPEDDEKVGNGILSSTKLKSTSTKRKVKRKMTVEEEEESREKRRQKNSDNFKFFHNARKEHYLYRKD